MAHETDMWQVHKEGRRNAERVGGERVMERTADYEGFVNELIWYIFNDWGNDDYISIEVMCRKLHKYGLIEKKDGHWMPIETDAEQIDCPWK